MEIKYSIPYVSDSELNYTDRIVLGFIIVLSSYGKTKEIFFSSDVLENMAIPMNSLKVVLKRLEQLGLIKNRIEQNYIYKKRFIEIEDKLIKICENLDNTIKTRKERKHTKNGTDIPPTDQKSILVNPDSNLIDFFNTAIDQLKQDGKIIPLSLNLTLEICNFKDFYNGKKISVDTVYKWLLKAI